MSEKKNTREMEMLGALYAGAALGGVIVFTLLSYFWEWGAVKGAEWWDVMTAFGTVGAAFGAVWVASRAEKRAEQERIRRGQSLKWFLAIKLGNIQIAAHTAGLELKRIIELGTPIPAAVSFGFELHQAMNWLNPMDVAMHLDSLYVLGDDAQQYAEVLALAEARYKDLARLSIAPITVSDKTPYLDNLCSQFIRLNERATAVMGLLNELT